jgi:tRNA A37 threonylcarbamoyltransferase TsaD
MTLLGAVAGPTNGAKTLVVIRRIDLVRYLLSFTALLTFGLLVLAADEKPDDTPKAAKTRKLLKSKITVDFKEERLKDALDEIQDQVKQFRYRLDTKGGVSANQTLKYKGKGVTIEEALDGMFKKNGLGYIIISKKGDAYDGGIMIRQGTERGYPKKK